MYEDEDVWPMRCPLCGHGFTAKIRHLKSGMVTKCAGCSHDLGHSAEEFYLALSEARKGKLNPWWDMVRRMAHQSPAPDVTHTSWDDPVTRTSWVEKSGLARYLWRAFSILRCPPFELKWADEVERRMAADGIVEAVDVTADCDRGFDPALLSSGAKCNPRRH